MSTNVLLRYGFSIGSIWMQEFEWHIMVPICLFGMSYALLKGEHVRVDVVFQYFSQRNKHLVDVITSVVAMMLCIIVIRLSIPYVWQSWSIGEGTANPGGIDYRYVIKSLIPIGFALFFVQSLSEAIKSFLAYRAA
jgi:TRAP-type mannitol/chloroaromatic compound transport system permease small subunit